MRISSAQRWFVTAILAAVLYLPPPAWAHRGGGPFDPCERRLGNGVIHLTLYQPDIDPDAEYCDVLPRAGRTVLVVDVSEGQLRHEPLSLQLIARGDDRERTVITTPPRVYRRGVVDTEATLQAGASYVARVLLPNQAGTEPRQLAFPIRVASWYRPLILPAAIVVALIMLVAISVLRYALSGAEAAPAPERSSIPRLDPRRRRRRVGSARSVAAALCALMLGCHSSASKPAPATGSEEPGAKATSASSGGSPVAASGIGSSRRAIAELPDIVVTDDHGAKLRLGSLRGKVVLLDFIHVGCPGACPMLTSRFGEVADHLGADLGSKVVLLSVTNDPRHDSPRQLLEMAKSAEADMKGWLFVTSDPKDIDRVLNAFGLSTEPLPDGSPDHITKIFLLGADGREIERFEGLLTKPEVTLVKIRQAVARQAESRESKSGRVYDPAG